MKLKFAVIFFFALLLCACSKAPRSYDAELCNRLAVKIERSDALSQQDYADMIDQSEQILKYLVRRNATLEDMEPEQRYEAYRELLADPEYMERFGYLFTLGSALYQAEAEGALDSRNAEAYQALDEYNSQFAEISDRM